MEEMIDLGASIGIFRTNYNSDLEFLERLALFFDRMGPLDKFIKVCEERNKLR